MLALPSLAQSRFREQGTDPLTGYLLLEDCLDSTKRLARVLPRLAELEAQLERWTRWPHPHFLAIDQIFAREHDLLLVFAPLEDAQAVERQCLRFGRPQVLRLFGELLSACQFLSDQQIHFPHLDPSKLLLTNAGLCIVGHETAHLLRPGNEPNPVQLDVRYAAPELISHRRRTQKSDVYQFGALLFHLLAGRAAEPGKAVDAGALGARWSATFLPLLHRLLQEQPDERPDWAELQLWLRRAKGPRQAARPAPVRLIAEVPERLRWLKSRLADALQSAAVAVVPCFPGGEDGRLLKPFATEAEAERCALFRLPRFAPSAESYSAINRLIALIGAALPLLERPELSVPPPLSRLSTWREQGLAWRKFLERLMPAILPRWRALILVVEEVDSWDPASLRAFATLFAWLSKYPALLVLTCNSSLHPHLSALRRRLGLPWSVAPLAELPPDLAAAFWVGEPRDLPDLAHGAARCGGQETPFLHWLSDSANHLRGLTRHWQASWQHLTANEQLLLLNLACSDRSLCETDLAALLAKQPASADLIRLGQAGWLRAEPDGYRIGAPDLTRFCASQVSAQDLALVHTRLYDHEMQRAQPDSIQLIHLACRLKPPHLAQHLAEQEHQFGDPDPLWLNRLERVYARSEHAELRDLAVLARLLRGEHKTRPTARHPFLAELAKLLRTRGSDPEAAARLGLRLARRGALGPNLRAYLLVLAAECAGFGANPGLMGRLLRRFARLDAPLPSPRRAEYEARLAAATTQLGRPAPILFARVLAATGPWSAWYEAWQHWQAGAFETCLAKLEDARPVLEQHADLSLRGCFFKLLGNALYRNNLPARASTAYAHAITCFDRIDHRHAHALVAFNQASAENLAGLFDPSRAHFLTIAAQAKASGDQLTHCQSLYYLMTCDLFQYDLYSFEARFREHETLATRLDNAEELAKGLALRLHLALSRSRAQVREELAKLERLTARDHGFHPLLRDEIDLAQRLARFAVGLAEAESTCTPGPFTAWRHQLLDFLVGRGGRDFAALRERLGSGYFAGCHCLLLRQAIEAGLLPQDCLDSSLAQAIERFASTSNAAYGALLRQHFGRAKDLDPAHVEHLERALGLFENLTVPPPAGYAVRVLEGLRQLWPFQIWGLAEYRDGRWRGQDPDHAGIVDQLNWLEPQFAEPTLRQLLDPGSQAVRGVLLLPLNQIVGALRLAYFVQDRLPAHEWSGHFDAVFRLYARLLYFAQPTQTPRESAPQLVGTTEIIGRSPALQASLHKITRFGRSDLNIFISGESGTGKELAARALHKSSARAHKPFRAVNCSHFPDTLVESELFGHARGAFTGADSSRVGVLELVDGGTLFLDEIGDINAKVQSLLLRVFQEGEFCRVGETQVRKVDIRFITATNKNLHELIDGGLFREDLFFRMVEEEIALPALRERLEDLPLLAHHFVRKYGEGRRVQFRGDFFDALRRYHWPGNIRELESYFRKLLVHWPRGEEWTAAEVIPFLREGARPRETATTLEAHLNDCRQELVRQRLARYGGNRTQAAQSLGISRQALLKIIDRFQLH